MLLMEEMDESKIPDSPIKETRELVKSIIEYNQKTLKNQQDETAMREMFRYYRDDDLNNG
jgi:hypothetical protein